MRSVEFGTELWRLLVIAVDSRACARPPGIPFSADRRRRLHRAMRRRLELYQPRHLYRVLGERVQGRQPLQEPTVRRCLPLPLTSASLDISMHLSTLSSRSARALDCARGSPSLRESPPCPLTSRGSLVYEYIGEVVMEKTFRKRMASYADEGIKHFYFMMLQKEEYIDATKKGGIGRFANHSCNPNCEVQKWVVGRRMRMGIFTKRDVAKDEEITFNYNVDRYGWVWSDARADSRHEAQICYCGEYNCVGTIGGKTQTDVGGIDDLFLDGAIVVNTLTSALGILDEVNAGGMRGNRKKKARQLDEDYVVGVMLATLTAACAPSYPATRIRQGCSGDSTGTGDSDNAWAVAGACQGGRRLAVLTADV